MEIAAQTNQGLDIGRILERRWHYLLLCAAAAALLAGIYCNTADKVYRSSVEILVMKKDASATSVSGGKSSEVQADVLDEVLSTHIRIFGSAQVVLDAVEKNKLDELPGIVAITEEGEMSAPEYILENLEVGRGGEGQAKAAQVLTASFSHYDGAEASLVLSTLVECYQEFLARTFDNVGSEALTLIENARDELGDELDAVNAEYAAFRNASPLLFAGEQAYSVHERELLQLSDMRAELKQKKSLTESRLYSIRTAMSGPTARQMTDSERLALIDDEHVQRLSLLVNVERGDTISEAFQADQPVRSEAASAEFDKLVSLRTEAGLLRTKFGDGHPRVAEVAGSIRELESFLGSREVSEAGRADKLEAREVIAAYVSLLENDLVHINRRLKETNAIIEDVAKQAKELESFELQEKMLAAKVESKEELYNAVVARIPELGMSTDFGGFETPIITPVTTAKQVWPNLLIVGAVAVAFGLTGGLGLALWSEVSDHTFQSADEVAEATGAPVLGTVPMLLSNADAADGNESEDSLIDAKLVALHRSRSADAEAIRSVRTALFFATQGAEQSVLQFTSPTPSDGKSLMSANVAVALASAGKKVLLVDADLRKPTQHKLFGVEKGEVGLADILVEQAEFPDAVKEVGVENLDLLPAGTLPPNPAELLSMRRFEEFLHSRRQQYDYVVVDTPPVLIVSDPLNVSSRVDGVVLVAPIKQNMAGATKQAAYRLDEVGANLLGAVVNDLEGRFAAAAGRYGQSSYGYSRYGNSYGYLSDASGYTSTEVTSGPAVPGSGRKG